MPTNLTSGPWFAVLCLGLAVASCAPPPPESRDQSSRASEHSADGVERPRAGTAEAAVSVASLFKDKVEFTVPELTGGKTNCDDVTRRPDLSKDIVPWPPALKGFLASQLEAFPAVDKALVSVFAIYLVKDEVLTDPGTKASAAGLACDRGTDYKGIIFLNEASFVGDRAEDGIGAWQNLRAVSSRHVLLEAGDNAAVTMIHEVLHAIDNKLLVNGTDEAARTARGAAMEASWKTFLEPKYNRISLYSLAESNTPAAPKGTSVDQLRDGLKGRGFTCRTRGTGDDAMGLTAATPEKLAEELKYLAEQTNFIVPYAMASAAEDFAESLTVYYFGVYQDSWQTRTVYAHDIRAKGPDGGQVLYKHDTAAILRTSKLQSTKACALANLVFGSCRL